MIYDNKKYKPRINSLTSVLLSVPLFRIKHLKSANTSNIEVIFQIAYSINHITLEPDWFNIENDYFYKEGNEEFPVTFKEFTKTNT